MQLLFNLQVDIVIYLKDIWNFGIIKNLAKFVEKASEYHLFYFARGYKAFVKHKVKVNFITA